jgi:hypothetical protein
MIAQEHLAILSFVRNCFLKSTQGRLRVLQELLRQQVRRRRKAVGHRPPHSILGGLGDLGQVKKLSFLFCGHRIM